MSTRFGVPMLAVLLTVGSANLARAAYCGAANYCHCVCSAAGVVMDTTGVAAADGAVAGATGEAADTGVVADNGATAVASDGSYTIMVTRRRVVYEPEQYTTYRTVYDTVYEDRTINTVRYVPETRTRTVNYTVRVPVWETRQRDDQLHGDEAGLGDSSEDDQLHA